MGIIRALARFSSEHFILATLVWLMIIAMISYLRKRRGDKANG